MAPEATTSKLSDIGARMKAAREALGLTQDDLAAEVGGSKRGIQNNEAHHSVPGGAVIYGLQRLGVNANWLLTGDGPMMVADLASSASLRVCECEAPAYANAAPAVDAALLQAVLEWFMAWQDRNRDRVRIDRSRHGAVISVLYRVAAQTGKVVDAELEQVLSIAA